MSPPFPVKHHDPMDITTPIANCPSSLQHAVSMVGSDYIVWHIKDTTPAEWYTSNVDVSALYRAWLASNSPLQEDDTDSI